MGTRFYSAGQKTNQELQKKVKFVTKKFTISLVYLFLGFLIGNLFGTLIDFFRLILWDGLIIVAIILLFEGISFLNYGLNLNLVSNTTISEQTSKYHNVVPMASFFNLIIKSINYLKLGVLLGFFIDAFKVGS